MKDQGIRIIDSRHPSYLSDMTDWEKWRLSYGGGTPFRDRYLEKFNTREDDTEFKTRKSLTPITTYAKAAINDVRNSIFQRLSDVVRQGGSEAYKHAVLGEHGGVDRRGSSMNFFLGDKPLTDLLVMGRVGIFIDMPAIYGESLAESQGVRPYLYYYQTEDILNYTQTRPEEPSEFSSILLRDSVLQYDTSNWLPNQVVKRYRKMWINENGTVSVQFYSADNELVDAEGNPSGPIELELTRIPFVLLDIGESLMKDVADHQIALMNLCSSDVNYALQSNFPFYTEMKDNRAVGGHLKKTASDGSASSGGQGAQDEVVKVGVTQGRYYGKDMERPGFIAPPSEPLEASLKLQDKLKNDVRELINLAVKNLGTRASAEAKELDNQGLDAGLSYIGLVLEGGERKIAEYWAAYEERVETRRQIATIKYPDKYSLKTDLDRIEEADKLSKLMTAVPGQTVKRQLAKNIVTVLLAGKVKVDTLQKIHDEIEESPYTTSDPDVIIEAKNSGLVGEKTASMALGFNDDEYLVARIDHTERVRRIQEAQTDPSARGLDDLSENPQAGRQEKEASRNTDLKDNTETPVRGKGKSNNEQ